MCSQILQFPGPRASERPHEGDDAELSVVIPAYNEARRLPQTLERLATWVSKLALRVEVIVVDDGSSDKTAAVAARHELGCSVIKLLRNKGKGAAVRTGMLHASGRVVGFTDADLPYDMSAMETAYTTIESRRADVAYGARDLPRSASVVPRAPERALASSCFRAITTALISSQVRDTQCGLKAFSLRAVHEIFPRVHTNGFAFDAEVILVAHRLGLTVERLPVELVNEAGSTVSLRRHAPRMLRDTLRATLRHARSPGPKSARLPRFEVLRWADVGVARTRRAA